MVQNNVIIPKSSKDYLENYIFLVMRQNNEFLHKNAKQVCDEIIWLINNAIDYVIFLVKQERSKEKYVRCAMSFYLQHILMPVSYGIYPNLLSGNLPVCFREFRVLLEALAKSYIADLKHSNLSFYEERVKTLKKEMYDKHISITKLMNEMDENLDLKNNNFRILWEKLSEEWVHPTGIVRGITDHIVERSDVPGYALASPMNYGATEIKDIKELKDVVSKFNSLLELTFKKYCKEINFE